MRASAETVLLAPVADAWRFATEPHLLASWWPGIAALIPDQLGLTADACWEVRRIARPRLFRKAAAAEEQLLVRAVDEHRLFAWQLTGQRIECTLRLTPLSEARTQATLTVTGASLAGVTRSLAKVALGRLHALCQTGADL